MAINNIIFDLGGVILDLGFDKMVKRFEELGISNFEQYFNPKTANDLFYRQEIGEISDQEFFDGFRKLTSSNLTNSKIENAWNLMLTDFVPERMNVLDKLSEDYYVALFSNTNAIHARRFEENCLLDFDRSLTSYFHKIYYSHNLHLRKPDVEAFEKVLKLSHLRADETLFIDDNADNIAGAEAAGLRAYHLTNGEQITDLDFDKLVNSYD